MRTWYFYDLSSGLFTGASFSARTDRDVEANTAQGCGAIEGVTHPHAQRVIVRGLFDYQPPRPSEHHAWDAGQRRWRLNDDAAAKANAHDQAMREIEQLEASGQRAVRELAIDPDNGAARARLLELEEQIAARRGAIARGRAAAEARRRS